MPFAAGCLLKRATLIVSMCVALPSLLLAPAAAAPDAELPPLTIIVPYPPGGSTDSSARIMQKAIAPLLDRIVVVENKPGANGNIGAAYVAGSPAGSDRILLATQPIITLSPHLYDNLPFDALKDLKPIVNASSSVVAVAVHPSLPVTNMAELIAYAKENNGKLNYGTSGAGSGQHVFMELLTGEAGVDMTHVPYRGAGPMATDLVAGHIQVGISTLSSFKPFMDAGTARILAITEPQRFEGEPDIPTVSETFPGKTLVPWLGYFGPANMPDQTVHAIGAAMLQALQTDEVRNALFPLGLVPIGDGPEDFKRSVESEYQRYGKVIRDHGITLN